MRPSSFPRNIFLDRFGCPVLYVWAGTQSHHPLRRQSPFCHDRPGDRRGTEYHIRPHLHLCAALGAASFLSQISIVFSMAATLNVVVRYGAMDKICGRAKSLPDCFSTIIRSVGMSISRMAMICRPHIAPCWIHEHSRSFFLTYLIPPIFKICPAIYSRSAHFTNIFCKCEKD